MSVEYVMSLLEVELFSQFGVVSVYVLTYVIVSGFVTVSDSFGV